MQEEKSTDPSPQRPGQSQDVSSQPQKLNTVSANPTPSVATQPSDTKTADPIAPKPDYTRGQSIGGAPTSYAGFWIRLLALIIDGIILGVIGGVATAVFGGAALVSLPSEPTAETTSIFAGLFGAMQFLIWAIQIAYFVGLTGVYGATVGKMVLGLKVVDTNGQKIGFGKAALREIIGKWISGLVFGLGYLWVAFDEKKQGWHDKIAGTIVIKTR